VENNLKQIKFVLWFVLVLNLTVALAKIMVGYLIRSNSMMADGFHSLADGSSNVIGLVGITAAMQPVDADHPYGHKKYETFSALGIAGLLGVAVLGILHEAFQRLANPVVPEVNPASFLVMLVTLGVNIWVVRYEKKRGEELKSDILISDSYHTGSDIYVSLSVIVTLVAVKFGLYFLDTVASLVIAILIAKAGWEIIKHSSSVLCDQAVLDEDRIVELVMTVEGVKGCHKVRSRGRADDLKVDLHIQVDPAIQIEKAHGISHEVVKTVCREIAGVSDVVVHVEPETDKND